VVPSSKIVYLGFFSGMTSKALDKIPPGPKLDGLTAEKVFGWHKREGSLVGKEAG